MSDYLLETRGLKMHFPIKKGVLKRTGGYIKAVDGVDLKVRQGETLGIVGESGCGKSTLARLILQILKPTSGEILFEGENTLNYSRNQMFEMRGNMQMVFQDPYASLNPRMKIGNIIAAPLQAYKKDQNIKSKVQDLMELVGLNPDYYNKYPHEFSGGQRQRIGIARAIALKPKLIICDEPVSALDVSIQAQVINLFGDLQKEFNLTYIFISHDLSVVKYIADRIAVMYLGRVMETASSDEFYEKASHPYTNSLLSAIPKPDPRHEKERKRIVLKGDVPSPSNPPSGCVFHTRCPRAQAYCQTHEPALARKGTIEGHEISCFFPIGEGEKMQEEVHVK
jgi:oligopeptide/dipeptide ABC transporter ATP-binding protein